MLHQPLLESSVPWNEQPITDKRGGKGDGSKGKAETLKGKLVSLQKEEEKEQETEQRKRNRRGGGEGYWGAGPGGRKALPTAQVGEDRAGTWAAGMGKKKKGLRKEN